MIFDWLNFVDNTTHGARYVYIYRDGARNLNLAAYRKKYFLLAHLANLIMNASVAPVHGRRIALTLGHLYSDATLTWIRCKTALSYTDQHEPLLD